MALRTQGPVTTLGLLRRVGSAPLRSPHGLEPPAYRRLVAGEVVAVERSSGRLVLEWHHPGLLGLLTPPVRAHADAGPTAVR